MYTFKTKLLTIAFLSFTLIQISQASVVSQSETVGNVNHTFGTVSSYDFSGYTGADPLAGVSFSWDLTMTGEVTADSCLDFQDCEPGSYDVFGDFEFGPGPSVEFFGDFVGGISGIDNSTNDLQTGIIDYSSTASFLLTDPTDLAAFLGGGIVATAFIDSFYDGFVLEADENDLSIASILMTGTLTLDYLSNPATDVPEPSVLTLMGLGLLGFIGMRRRSRISA